MIAKSLVADSGSADSGSAYSGATDFVAVPLVAVPLVAVPLVAVPLVQYRRVSTWQGSETVRPKSNFPTVAGTFLESYSVLGDFQPPLQSYRSFAKSLRLPTIN